MFAQIPYVRGSEYSWGADKKPPHHFAPDGSWISDILGIGVSGEVERGRDPETGLYAPGDSYIGNRPVYYNETGLFGFGFRPYMDPDGFTGPKSNFDRGFGGNNGSVAVTPPVAAPITAPIVVATARPVLPVVVEGDTGARRASMSADDVAATQHAQSTPSPVFTLPQAFLPPVFGRPEIMTFPTFGPSTIAKEDARYLLNGTLTDGNGKVLNANRPAPTMTGDASGTVKDVGPQLLPTNNTVATATDSTTMAQARKYLPYLLALFVLLVVIHYATKKKGD